MTAHHRGIAAAVLTLVVTVGFFGVLAYLIANGLPESGRDAILIMLGTLGTAWTACVSYFVGSTVGSAMKTAAMERMATGGSNQP